MRAIQVKSLAVGLTFAVAAFAAGTSCNATAAHDTAATANASDSAKAPAAKVTTKTLKPQATCPVMGGAIDKSVFTDYKGKRVYFCCSDCKAAFGKDPQKYLDKLAALGEAVEDAPKAPAKE